MAKSKNAQDVHASPAMPPALNEEHMKHLKEGYRNVRNAYSFLTAHNTRHAQEQLLAGLSQLDRVLAPWL